MSIIKTTVSVLVLATLILIAFQNRAFAAERKVKFNVEGVTCLCSYTKAKDLPKREKGVLLSEPSVEEGAVTVVFDDAIISTDDLKEIFRKDGLPVSGEAVLIQ